MLPAIQSAVDQLKRIPSIGDKSAQRLLFHILEQDAEETEALLSAISTAKRKIRLCSRCYCYSEQEICPICSDPRRENGLVVVVESPRDVVNLERLNIYFGRYFVLGGVLSPIRDIGPEDIRCQQLLNLVSNSKIEELIFALNQHLEAETTVSYLLEKMNCQTIKISRLAMGIPVGFDIEYTDPLTLKHSLISRTSLK